MAHLTLQVGSALVVPFAPSRWAKRRVSMWRSRSLVEAAVSAADRSGRLPFDASTLRRVASRLRIRRSLQLAYVRGAR